MILFDSAGKSDRRFEKFVFGKIRDRRPLPLSVLLNRIADCDCSAYRFLFDRLFFDL